MLAYFILKVLDNGFWTSLYFSYRSNIILCKPLHENVYRKVTAVHIGDNQRLVPVLKICIIACNTTATQFAH
jgi:hypothetical protein